MTLYLENKQCRSIIEIRLYFLNNMAFIDLFIKSEDENSGQTHTVVSTPTESVGSPRNLNIGNQTSPIESVS